jgi:hypothetical protein
MEPVSTRTIGCSVRKGIVAAGGAFDGGRAEDMFVGGARAVFVGGADVGCVNRSGTGSGPRLGVKSRHAWGGRWVLCRRRMWRGNGWCEASSDMEVLGLRAVRAGLGMYSTGWAFVGNALVGSAPSR